MRTIELSRDEAELIVDLLEGRGPDAPRHDLTCIELAEYIRTEWGMWGDRPDLKPK